MQFWHDLVTEQSWEILKQLQRKFAFVLIGGWAVWLYSKNLKSKDIDLICDYEELEKFKKEYPLVKNNRLKKYEAKIKDIDIDIYLPYFSHPGLPVEKMRKHLSKREGFVVPELEILFILKQKAYQERRLSSHGQKDKLDLLSLLSLEEFNWSNYRKFLKKYHQEKLKNELINLLKNSREAKELGLNQQKMAKIKKRILPLLKR